MKRVLWLLVGLGAGAVVGIEMVRSARSARDRYAPASVAKRAGAASASFGSKLRVAFEAGRAEMALREAELRAEIGLPDA